MIRALDELYSKSVADVIIIGSGGGSIEDLWAFNSEELARKIFESPVPVISAVGHETDFTICDFVADLRAPTPSAAAELAVPDKEEMLETLKNYELILKKDLVSKLEFNKQRLRTVLSAQGFKNPVDFIINRRFENLDRISDKLTAKAFEKTKNFENDLMAKALKLDALSPLKVLARGYSAVTIDNKIINSIDEVKSGDIVSLRFKNGKANAEIKDIEKGE
jgi:exodeoxyribonuclease VII large subunit